MVTRPESTRRSSNRRAVIRTAIVGGAIGVTGCLGGNSNGGTDEFVLAAEALDDPEDVERDWAPLAERIEAETGVRTTVDRVSDDAAAIGALAAGQAHAAYLSGGPAWVGWNAHGFETLAVEADEEGRTYYVAAAYTRSDTGIESMRDAAGVDSAHTGELAGAGMLIPTAYLAREGLVSFADDDDVTAIRSAVDAYFGDPIVGGGYVGALEALSRGQADIAFGRNTTPEDYCGGDDVEAWCLNLDEYEIVEEFTRVPSHPLLAGAGTTPEERALLGDALRSLNDDDSGREILADVLNVHQLQAATSEEHLGPYGELISELPGIEDHLLE